MKLTDEQMNEVFYSYCGEDVVAVLENNNIEVTPETFDNIMKYLKHKFAPDWTEEIEASLSVFFKYTDATDKDGNFVTI